MTFISFIKSIFMKKNPIKNVLQDESAPKINVESTDFRENTTALPIKSTKYRIFELFSGLGTQSLALKGAGIPHEVVGTCDWFIPAICCYNAIHNPTKLKEYLSKKTSKEVMISYLQSKSLSIDSKKLVNKNYWTRKNDDDLHFFYSNVLMSEKEFSNYFDIHSVKEGNMPKYTDILTYSFPCQDISNQGNQKGFEKGSKTSSGLLWEVERLIYIYIYQRPKYLIMENVFAIVNTKNIDTLNNWKAKLNSFGYDSKLYVVNSQNFGSIQNRKRVLLISKLKSITKPLPNLEGIVIRTNNSIKSILDKEPINWKKNYDISSYLDKYEVEPFRETASKIIKAKLLGFTTFNSEATIYDIAGKSPTLTAKGAQSRLKFYNSETNTLSLITPAEAFKLMGHSNESFLVMYNLIKDHVNETQLLHVAGNAIEKKMFTKIVKEVFGE